MYAKNMQTLVHHLLKDGAIHLDFSDEITRGATITHGGKVINEATAKALGIEVSDPTGSSSKADAPAASAGEEKAG
jgi:NAD(P) transhydrogenase subunit alpha